MGDLGFINLKRTIIRDDCTGIFHREVCVSDNTHTSSCFVKKPHACFGVFVRLMILSVNQCPGCA